MAQPNRYLIADFGRGIAAAGVVFYHSRVFGTGNLYLLVDYFFVLSGFVLTSSFDRISSFQDFKSFMLKRIWRFFPLVWLVVLVKTALQLAKRVSGLPVEHSMPGALDIVSAMLLLQLFVASSVLVIVPLWSLSAELFGNLGFALAPKALYSRVMFALGGLILIWLGSLVRQNGGGELGPIEGLQGLGRAVFGIGLGIMIHRLPDFKKRTLPTVLAVAATFALLTLPDAPYKIYVAGLVFSTLIWSLRPMETSVRQDGWFAKVSSLFGKISFGIYVWHDVLSPLDPLVHKVPLPHTGNLVVGLVRLLASAVLAWLTFRYVETPAMNFYKKRIAKSSQ